MTNSIRIVVIEDQALVRQALVALFELQGPDLIVVGQAPSGKEGIKLVAHTMPDVALLDIQMADGDGISATQTITQNYPKTRCLLLTTFAKDAYLMRGLDAGARGYVLKDTPIQGLVQAIRAVADGQLWISKEMQSRWTPWSKDTMLSERELEIVRLASTGMTNRDIAGALYMAEGTIKNLWTEILQKMDAKNRVEAIATARSRGFVD